MKWREFKKNAALVIISTLFSLFIGEVIVRYHLYGFDGLSYSQMQSHSTKRWRELIQLSDDNKLEYELQPNLDKHYLFKNFKTNSQGYNDRDYTIEKSDSTIRVAVIGDSYTMGWGIERKDIYHELIEKRLNSKSSTLKYEFINFAVAGYNFQNYIRVLETKAIRYKPDVILIGFCSKNDFRSPKGQTALRQERQKRNKKGFYSWYLFKFVSAQLLRRPVREDWKKKENDEFVQSAFSDISDLSKKHDIPVAIAYLSVAHLPEDPLRLRIDHFSKINDFKFIDTSPLFANTNVKDYTLNFFDLHPNEEAHEFFATSILDSFVFKRK